jgi:putative peptidoglycan lipid II flippase
MRRRGASSPPNVPVSAALLARPAGAVGDSLTVAAWTLVSRVTGFGRVATIAAVLGPTYFGNTYQATNTLPNIIYYGLLAGSLLSSLLVPALVRHIDANDRASCGRVAGGALGLLLAGLATTVPVALVLAPLLLRVSAVGPMQSGLGIAQEGLARWFLLMMLPQVLLYAVVGCASAVMHAHRRFALPAAAPAVENLASIGVLVAAAALYPDGAGLDDIPTGELLLLGLGSTAAVALHATIQWLGARRTGATIRPSAGWRDAEVITIIRSAAPSLVQAVLLGTQLLAVLLVTNRIAGGVVAYQVAAGFFALPIALGATPVALSLLPRLSRLHQRGDLSLCRDVIVRGLRFALFVTMPAAVAMAVLAPVLATAVSFGRMRVDGAEAMVATVLLVLAPAVVGETAFLVGVYASYAQNDTWSPLRSMLVKFGVCLTILIVAVAGPGRSVPVLAGLAVSAAAVAGAAHRVIALLRGVALGAERLVPGVTRTAVAATVSIVPLWIGRRLLAGVDQQLLALAGTAAVCVVSAMVYLAVQVLLRAPESTWLLGALKRPLSRSAAGRETIVEPGP